MNSDLLDRIEPINVAIPKKLPRLQREFHVETQANLANIVIQEFDKINSSILPIEKMELWDHVVEGMKMYENLGFLYMLVDSNNWVCVVATHYIKSGYRKKMYFQYLDSYKIAILKHEYRANWSEFVNPTYANDFKLYPRTYQLKEY